MSTTATPAAVAAPAVSAPVAAPATATPVTPAAPVVETPVSAPPPVVDTPAAAEPGTPAAPAGDAPKVAPKLEDFDSNEEYLAAKIQFEDESGLLDKPAGTEIDPNAPAETAPGAEVTDVLDPVEPAKPADVVAATPEAIAGWMEAHPALKAALDGAPEVKESIFNMARENAKLAPVGEIFPDLASAQFANDTAGQFVELQTAFQMSAEDPESFPEAFSKFEDLFRLRDEKGEYLRDSAGNIRVGEDFNLLATHLVSGYQNNILNTYTQQVKDLETRLETGVYPNAEAKALDERALETAETALASIRFLKALDGGAEDKPDLSKIADPAVRAYYERKEKELEEQRKALGQDKADTATANRKTARAQYEGEFQGKFGGTVGTRIGDLLKQKLDAGTFIPSYILEARHKDPKSGAMVPTFAIGLLDEFNAKTGNNSNIRQQRAKLQLLKPSPAAMEQRLKYEQDLIETYMPTIIDSAVAKVQSKEKADRAARQAKVGNRGEVAEVEPRSGGTPTPRTMTDDQLLTAAKEAVSKQPGYDSMSPAEINTAVLSKKYELRFGGGR